MIRFTHTTAGQLKKGDRFYFLSDKKKKVHQVHSFGLVSPFPYPKWGVIYDYLFIKLPSGKKMDFSKKCLKTTEVIFLRHTQPQTIEIKPISSV